MLLLDYILGPVLGVEVVVNKQKWCYVTIIIITTIENTLPNRVVLHCTTVFGLSVLLVLPHILQE